MTADRLLDWYRANARDLPWRRTRDPFAIWVSEVMLQQTQVKTVLPYYDRFLTKFPTAESFAQASEEELLAAWQGLGYYRRARNLQAGTRRLAQSGWPTTASQWREMPGVGAYTAAALASIIHGERIAVVDGNVERVYARTACDSSVGSGLTANARIWAQSLIEQGSGHPGDLNQALMELGATVCTPRNPSCSKCPIARDCRALREGRVEELPVPEPKPETVRLERFGLAYIVNGQIGLRQIPRGEWWEGMWTLPWQPEPPAELVQRLGTVRHTVTHHRLLFHVLRAEERPENISLFALDNLPALPSLQQKAIRLLRSGIQ